MENTTNGGVAVPRHRCVVIDPPWNETGGGKSRRGADRHYALMKTPQIIKLVSELPVVCNMHHDAHGWVWVTDNYLPDGLALLRALGFRYVRALVWVKVKQAVKPGLKLTDAPLVDQLLQKGLGQYLRGSHEMCLFGTRGRAQVPATGDRRPSVVFAPRTRHSAKPDCAFSVIERVSPGPRLELFARAARPGWTAWGDEVPCR